MRFTAVEYIIFTAILASLCLFLVEFEYGLQFQIAYGVIWNTVIGLAMGSYATSFVARIPKNIPSFTGRNPYCLSCGTTLETVDLFPVLSWIFIKQRCRHCGVKIPPVLFYTELAVLINFIICYLVYGFSEFYLVVSAFCTCSIILAMIFFSTREIAGGILNLCFLLSVVYRVRFDDDIYGAILRVAISLGVAAIFYRKLNINHPFHKKLPLLIAICILFIN